MSKSASILVVDDCSIDREIVSIACRSLECEVEMAGSATEALEMYRAKRHTLVLTDYQMEPLNGIELVVLLKDFDREVECILMTGYPDARLMNFVHEHELSSIITKPIRPGNLRDQLRVALNRDRGATLTTSGIVLTHRMDDCLSLLGESIEICGVRKRISQLLDDTQPLLIEGPCGTGKLEIARFIHENGPFGESHYVECHCADMDLTALHGQLLGPDGSWGALLEVARKGTLVIDNIETLPIAIQQTFAREFRSICEEMHVICLADIPLEQLLDDGRLDEMLYFEISLEILRIPAVPERLMDVDDMVRFIAANPVRYRLERELRTVEIDALIAQIRRSSGVLNTESVRDQVRDYCRPIQRV